MEGCPSSDASYSLLAAFAIALASDSARSFGVGLITHCKSQTVYNTVITYTLALESKLQSRTHTHHVLGRFGRGREHAVDDGAHLDRLLDDCVADRGSRRRRRSPIAAVIALPRGSSDHRGIPVQRQRSRRTLLEEGIASQTQTLKHSQFTQGQRKRN